MPRVCIVESVGAVRFTVDPPLMMMLPIVVGIWPGAVALVVSTIDTLVPVMVAPPAMLKSPPAFEFPSRIYTPAVSVTLAFAWMFMLQ